MATTTWIVGSGDWNTASNWSNGVPTAADTAVFTGAGLAPGSYTVTGNGTAALLSLAGTPLVDGPFFAGTLSVGSFTDTTGALGADDAALLGSAALGFAAATIAGGARFEVQAGATFGGGPITLANGTLTGSYGALTNPISLLGNNSILGTATLTGSITGTGLLQLEGDVVLANPGNTYSGGTLIGPDGPFAGADTDVTLTATGVAGTGPIVLGGTLTLEPGVVVGPITAAINEYAVVQATDQSGTVFAGSMSLLYENGSGHPTIVGTINPGPEPEGEGPGQFGAMTVQGGTGSVTVFGGNKGGLFQGGSAGHNVLVGGADLSAYPGTHQFSVLISGGATYVPGPVTLVGGGDGDLLVATGTDNSASYGGQQANVLVAGAGSETLTGSGSSGRNVFFGGTGADVIAAGAGASTVLGGPGSATISGGSGTAAIFAGGGQDVILGGIGADYVQASTGNATLFAGAGADLVGAVHGQSGGSLVVSGFRVGTDQLDLQGYGGGMTGITNSQVANGSTALTLVDGTHITLLGVTNLGAGSFV